MSDEAKDAEREKDEQKEAYLRNLWSKLQDAHDLATCECDICRLFRLLDRARADLRRRDEVIGPAIIACKAVSDAVRAQNGNAEKYFNEDSWNPDAHVEVTITVADVRAVFAALAAAKEGEQQQ